jgi:hypothetical protein
VGGGQSMYQAGIATTYSTSMKLKYRFCSLFIYDGRLPHTNYRGAKEAKLTWHGPLSRVGSGAGP